MQVVAYLICVVMLGFLGGIIGRGWAMIIAQLRKTTQSGIVGGISAAASIYLLIFCEFLRDGLKMNTRLGIGAAAAALVFGYFFSRPGKNPSSTGSKK